jgi:tRNA nucleotidyltransferase/poly(A) polymerase
MSKKANGDDSPYSGRWVARLGGRIVGQGGTPEAARRAAGATRHKEKAEVSYMKKSWSPPLADLISKIIALSPDSELYLVGGAIRDALLERTSHDFDFVVPENAIGLARRVARALEADFYVLDQAFGAARVIVRGADGERDFLDFSDLRGGSIEADLAGRDFSINAIALKVRDGTTLDPQHGTADLRAKVIRACTPSALEEDPIRILRAVRLAAALDFSIEARTRQGLRAAAHLLPSVSAERQRDEWFRMLGGRRVEACVRALEMLGVLPHSLPELGGLKGVEQPAPHVHDVWDHTLSVMGHLEEILDLVLDGSVEDANGLQASLLTLGVGRYRKQLGDHFSTAPNPDRPLRAMMQFAALYHDVGKPARQSRGEDGRLHFLGHENESAVIAVKRGSQMNLSNAELDWIQAVIAHHLRFYFLASRMEAAGEAPSRRAVYRFFRDAGSVGIELILLALADMRGKQDHLLTESSWSAWVSVARNLLEHVWERPEVAVAPPRLVDGNELMRELALQPGPAIGQILEAVREAQAAGDVHDREAAIDFAREWAGRNPEMRAD